jgi:lipopolysaccharide transport system permease protein
VVWVLLQPLMGMGVFTVFFGRLAQLPSDGLPYPVFNFAALAPWTYFSTALTTATNVVVEISGYTKVYFPRLILPLSNVMSRRVDFGIAFVVLLTMLGYGLRPGVSALWLPLLALLALATALGVGLWLSALNALYRDVKYVTPILVQFWMPAIACSVLEQLGAGEIAVVVRIKSDGQGDRGIPVGVA